jgi:NAD(P)-dependent dehydrogenase (short-subunit alcohol dehydrogenase family)
MPMSGKTCAITGATSGIGKATALALARKHAVVILICRDKEKGRAAVLEIQEAAENDNVECMVADLSSQKQIRGLARRFDQKYKKLHVLVNNAGAMFPKRLESIDGIEMTLAVNHLAPFLLTNLLLDNLKAAGEARIINVNSDAHKKGKIDFADIQMRRHYPYGVGMRAYANAKLANLLTVFELAQRLRPSEVTVNALHPGYVATNILPFEDTTGPVRLLKPLWALAKGVILTPAQGAITPVHLACSPAMVSVSGLYFQKSAPVASSATSRDPNLQKKMWDVSERLTQG